MMFIRLVVELSACHLKLHWDDKVRLLIGASSTAAEDVAGKVIQ